MRKEAQDGEQCALTSTLRVGFIFLQYLLKVGCGDSWVVKAAYPQSSTNTNTKLGLLELTIVAVANTL